MSYWECHILCNIVLIILENARHENVFPSLSVTHKHTHTHTHTHAFPHSPPQSVSLSLSHTLTHKGLRVPDEFSHSLLFISICVAIFSHVCFDSMQMNFFASFRSFCFQEEYFNILISANTIILVSIIQIN